MTPDPERIARLENRVDKIEGHLGVEVEKLSNKIDALGAVINNHLIAAAKNTCPAPGSCVALSTDLRHVIASHDQTMRKVLYLEGRILLIEKWQGRMIGGIAVLMVLLTLFGDNIKHLFRIP
jgi:hypothetical protein